jgi:hypothetical protein
MFGVSKKLLLSVVLGAFLPSILSAATPTAYLERSKVIATGRQIKAYSVPTKDEDGTIRYYDITINLPILANGKPRVTAPVISVPSPRVRVNEFVPGTYTGGGASCTLLSSPFGARTEVVLNCTFNGYNFSATWYTGPIAGHPYQIELENASIDTLPRSVIENFAWGKVGNTDNRYWWNNCILYNTSLNDILAIRQVNNRLTFHNYRKDNISDCQVDLIRTGP